VNNETPVKSPCVHVCILNDDDVCTGCFRSGHEISRWGRMSNDEKRQVLVQSQQREAASGSVFIISND